MIRSAVMLLAAGLLAMPAPAQPPDRMPPEFYAALKQADSRVAAIAYRLATANAALCRRRQPQLGVVWLALDQFAPGLRPAAAQAFGLSGNVGVEAVVPGSGAARAGLRPGDVLVAVADAPLPAAAPAASADGRNYTERLIADQRAEAPVRLTLQRDGRDRPVAVAATPGCRVAAELVLDEGWTADSDGERIRIGARFLERFGDADLAVVIAHELAHVVLEHRRRLDAARVDDGLLRELGRNGRLFRQTEDDADALSVALLYNAGYDPGSAAAFWRGGGGALDGGLFRARTHRAAGARAVLVAKAAAAIPAEAPRPYRPALVDSRDQPLR